MSTQLERANRFRDLNRQGRLLLGNAWDAGSAAIYQSAGYAALGTTSGGIAYAQGRRDAQTLGRDAMAAAVAAICRAVAIPVSADIEAGYGDSPEAVAATVRAVIEAGAVGVNLEDRDHGAGGLYPCESQCLRLAAARAEAERSGLPIWLNARIDTFLLGAEESVEERLASTLARANRYLAAGADMVFVPGLVDPTAIRRLVAGLDGPLNVMAFPGMPTAEALFAAGVARVSLGVSPMLALMGLLREIAVEARESGEWNAMGRSFYGFAEAESLFGASEV